MYNKMYLVLLHINLIETGLGDVSSHNPDSMLMSWIDLLFLCHFLVQST